MNYRIPKIICLLVIAIVIGFFQEKLKVNINYIIETGDKINGFFNQSTDVKKQWLEQVKVDAPYDYYHNHGRIESLISLSRNQLVAAKWVVTILFVMIFMAINALLLKWVTGNMILVKWCFKLYAVFFALSFAIYLFGILTGSANQAYGVSRKIVGGLQSLVPLMVLLTSHWIFKSQLMSAKK